MHREPFIKNITLRRNYAVQGDFLSRGRKRPFSYLENGEIYNIYARRELTSAIQYARIVIHNA